MGGSLDASGATAVGPHSGSNVFRWVFRSASWPSATMAYYMERERANHRLWRHSALGLFASADGTRVAYLRDNGPPPKRAHISYSKERWRELDADQGQRASESGTSVEVIPLFRQRELDRSLQRSGERPVLISGGHLLRTKVPPGNGSGIWMAARRNRARINIITHP